MRKKAKRRPPSPPPATTEPAPGRLEAWLEHHRMAYPAASLLLLIPCFWQSRLQAGDLGSHIYNAWLAQLIHQGRAPGLAIVPQTTNVLFDLILGGLFAAFGAAAAQRIAVSLAVLVFAWGAFAFLAAATRRSWPLFPAIAMLAYGWVFHMGFFNFYLSLGLSFWALATAWSLQPVRIAAALPLLALAYVAHGLPMVWASLVLVYLWLARYPLASRRWHLAGLAVFAVIVLHMALSRTMMTRWTPSQAEKIPGVDQVWVFGDHYWIVAFGLLALWCLLAIELFRRRGMRQVFGSDMFQVFALSAAGVALLPTWIWMPAYRHALVFVSERMSLPLGVCLCALFAMGGIRFYQRCALIALAVVFFALLYQDERALNQFEDQIDSMVAHLPPGQRILSSVEDPNLRTNALTHIVDRACIQRCYSYANYEPSSSQFRIRTVGESPLVAATDMDASRMQNGNYVVKPRDLPLYQIVVDAAGRLRLDSLAAGTRVGLTQWNGL